MGMKKMIMNGKQMITAKSVISKYTQSLRRECGTDSV